MWRHWSRGLKRSLCLERWDSHTSDISVNRKATLCCIAKLLPKSLQHLDRCIVSNINHDNGKKKDNEENSTKNISDHTFLEAFGWSGALVFGWLISKQWWLRQTWSWDRDSCSNKKYNFINDQHLIDLLTRVVKTQPPINYVLPPHPSFPTENNGEDEFEAAAKQLQDIHQKAIGEALNRRGIAYLSKSAGSEAIKFFKRASELNYSPASFNLGQCCELGIGIKQDFNQAAEWYKIASEQGHPTAMYNLGVFYAHGWGGLKSDIKMAKSLFEKAAELGQPDAKVALEKESKSSHKLNLINKVKSSQIPIGDGNVKFKAVNMHAPDLELFVNKITNELADSVIKRDFGTGSNWDVPLKSSVAF